MSYSNSSKRPRGFEDDYMSGRNAPILDTPRFERSLRMAEEERLRQLEEIAQLKREHELTLLRFV